MISVLPSCHQMSLVAGDGHPRQALAVSVGLAGFLAGRHQVFDVSPVVAGAAIDVVVLDRVGDAATRRDVGDDRLGPGVFHVAGEEVVLEPGLAGIGAAVDHEAPAMIEDVVHGLKPEVGQVSGGYLVYFHAV